MTQPTHGLDPKALEAALREAIGELEIAVSNRGAGAPAEPVEAAWARIEDLLAALSQNPGTSGDEPYVPTIIRNESAGFYEFVTEDVPALYREAVVDALRGLYEAFLSRHGCFPLDRVTAEQCQWNDAMVKANAAIRKLSEVSHEH